MATSATLTSPALSEWRVVRTAGVTSPCFGVATAFAADFGVCVPNVMTLGLGAVGC